MTFHTLIAIAAVLAGAIASVSGFGIGSILTPLVALETGTKVAVAAVSIPHFLGTALRFWRLRNYVDRHVLVGFGAASVAGGLAGAWLLIFAGVAGLAGLTSRMRFGRRAAYVAGGASGLLGGLVGNQGGIRSAAMLGFDVPKESFVATATAIALLVDAARVPVYFATEAARIWAIWPLVVVSSAGVVVGTLTGEKLLRWLPESLFRRLVSLLILALGIFVIFTSGNG